MIENSVVQVSQKCTAETYRCALGISSTYLGTENRLNGLVKQQYNKLPSH